MAHSNSFGAAVSDLASLVDVGFEASIGTGAASMMQKIMQKRLAGARDILLEEIREGKVHISEAVEGDEIVAVAYRFARSAMEGAARVNLRLMAKALKKQLQEPNLLASKFQHHAAIIASLRREEIILLCGLYEIEHTAEYSSKKDDQRPGWALGKLRDRFIPSLFANDKALMATLIALTRTGFVIPETAWDTFVYSTSPNLSEVISLEEFEDALRGEADT
ncbi:hypothetical protein [Thalassospira sp. UBA1131]|uniref:hypothetical protein n=1 Tax=Thalassospira sp. UBA1131 TaxID=1947672 RepID=UPI0025F666C0|nr:hypothetical protein [Thalassospira sp. UBA1131]